MKYYLIGIKGTGMTSLASLLKDLGHDVIGSDVSDYYFTEDMLQEKKIPYFSFDKENIDASNIYIIGNAFHSENIEVSEVIDNNYEYYYYQDFIGKVLKKQIIAISGTHGKTTVTCLLSQMLGKDFSYICGDGTGYGTNRSNYLILEACEYQRHFLSYWPEVLLINNIELDHPDYYQTNDEVIKSFQEIANQSNVVVVNNDDVNCKYIKHSNIVTFGFSKDSDYKIDVIEEKKNGYLINITNTLNKYSDSYFISFLGKHMIYNCVGGIIISNLLKKKPKLENLFLPKRRMTTYKFKNVIIIDDYAHHPTEIKCLYESIIKTYPDKKTKVIFQPHTYSRTLKFKSEFIKILDLFDEVYLEKVFTSKREGYNLTLEKEISNIFNKYNQFHESVLSKISVDENAVWVFLGAGVVNRYIKEIINK